MGSLASWAWEVDISTNLNAPGGDSEETITSSERDIMIRNKVLAVLASGAAAVATLGVGAPANASTSGHYFAGADSLQCRDFVLGDGNGGSLSVKVFAGETRPDVDHFRGAYVVTRLIAQEKTYSGTWKNVKYGKKYIGVPDVADVSDHTATSLFTWGGDPNPRLTITVTGQDDVFRVVARQKIYSDEDALLANLRDVQGNCHL